MKTLEEFVQRGQAAQAAVDALLSGPEFRTVRLEELVESPTNPRRHFDPAKLKELAESVRANGVLVPLLVRERPPSFWRTPAGGRRFEIVAGARRYRAAHAAGVADVPVRIRPLTDAQVLEIQVLENLLREDLHPLEEADGYRQLMATGYDVAEIASRVCRSVKYVYDRVKLLSLTKPAQKLFLDGKITAGHAILLARLRPADQARCIGEEPGSDGGLFMQERTLWDPEAQAEEDSIKPVSVRELQAWIDEQVKFDRAAADPMLFPETVQQVAAATEAAEKVIQITHDSYVQREARDPKERIYSPRSWKRVEGKKVCPKAVTGVVVVGPGRGEAFKVCTDKETCKVHWAAEQRERKRRADAAGRGMPTGTRATQTRQREQAQREEQRKREEAEHARWTKATPAILEAVAAAVKKASTRAGGLLADIVLDQVEVGYGRKNYTADYMPRGTTSDDLIRHAAFAILMNELQEWRAPRDFPKRAKAFGVDVRKIVDREAPAKIPVQTSAPRRAARAS